MDRKAVRICNLYAANHSELMDCVEVILSLVGPKSIFERMMTVCDRRADNSRFHTCEPNVDLQKAYRTLFDLLHYVANHDAVSLLDETKRVKP